ncbi:MAG: hypothetical protein V1853_03680 [bacterium]
MEQTQNLNPAAPTMDEPTSPQIPQKSKTVNLNPMVEVMEGITLAALLILFSFLWMMVASLYMGATWV